jgi:hypothetical protein
MTTKQSDGIDPRFDPAFQRGGAGSIDVTRAAPAPRLTAPEVDDPAAVPTARGLSTRRTPAEAFAPDADEKHFELIVAGNPWLRSLWLVGGLTTVLGFALTFYAEFAFSAPPASGIYDPSAYIVPRLAEALALPLVIAGVVALVAATTLRLVAWRPSGARAISSE